jgi:N-acetylmuramoyl-L-alanine amidase
MCRLRDRLLQTTRAEVITTIKDRSSGFHPIDGRIRRDSDEQILSDPPFDLRSRGATTIGVNLRWKIANAELARQTAAGVSADRVVFLSIHADSLHPSIRGTMLYVPGPEHRRSIPSGVSVTDLRRAEGLSRGLARGLLRALRERKIAVEPYLPIRNHVIRSGKEWIPAVLRDSRVPHSLLVEVANLNNDEDRTLILSGEFRQRMAEAIVSALTRYYAEPETRTVPVAGRDHGSL